jgi:hypothetical protein
VSLSAGIEDAHLGAVMTADAKDAAADVDLVGPERDESGAAVNPDRGATRPRAPDQARDAEKDFATP